MSGAKKVLPQTLNQMNQEPSSHKALVTVYNKSSCSRQHENKSNLERSP